MSQQEEGYRSAVKIGLAIVLAIIFGPWLTMIVLAFFLEPRTGSWGAWPHIIGGGWIVAWVAFVVWTRLR